MTGILRVLYFVNSLQHVSKPFDLPADLGIDTPCKGTKDRHRALSIAGIRHGILIMRRTRDSASPGTALNEAPRGATQVGRSQRGFPRSG